MQGGSQGRAAKKRKTESGGAAGQQELLAATDGGESVASDGAPLPLHPDVLEGLQGAGDMPLEELSKRMARARMTHAVIRQRAEGQFVQYGGAAPAFTGAEAPDERALQSGGLQRGAAGSDNPLGHLQGPDRGPSSVDMSSGASVASREGAESQTHRGGLGLDMDDSSQSLPYATSTSTSSASSSGPSSSSYPSSSS